MRRNFEWFLEENLREKIDDLAKFIKEDLAKLGITDFDDKIDADVAGFVEEGTEIRLYDNGQGFNHFSCFIKFKDGKMVEWMPFWVS